MPRDPPPDAAATSAARCALRAARCALRAARELEFGGVLVNDVPTTRFEHQPYGGGKDSGNTREGPAATLRELTEERFVALR